MAYHLLMRQDPTSTAPTSRLVDHLDNILLQSVVIPSILLVNLSFYIKCVRTLQGECEGRCRGAGLFLSQAADVVMVCGVWRVACWQGAGGVGRGSRCGRLGLVWVAWVVAARGRTTWRVRRRCTGT
jgi:hypothetical protein